MQLCSHIFRMYLEFSYIYILYFARICVRVCLTVHEHIAQQLSITIATLLKCIESEEDNLKK